MNGGANEGRPADRTGQSVRRTMVEERLELQMASSLSGACRVERVGGEGRAGREKWGLSLQSLVERKRH